MTHARVLVSDDEAPLVRALARLLKRQGVEAIEDVDADVVSLAEREQPDLILLDVNHKVDGIGLLKALKEDPHTRRLHVVMMSGNDSPADRMAALDAGADDYLLKPFGNDVLEELLEKIQKWREE